MAGHAARVLRSLDEWLMGASPQFDSLGENARRELAERLRAFEQVSDMAALDAAAHALASFLDEQGLLQSGTAEPEDRRERVAELIDSETSFEYLRNKFVQLGSRVVELPKPVDQPPAAEAQSELSSSGAESSSD